MDALTYGFYDELNKLANFGATLDDAAMSTDEAAKEVDAAKRMMLRRYKEKTGKDAPKRLHAKIDDMAYDNVRQRYTDDRKGALKASGMYFGSTALGVGAGAAAAQELNDPRAVLLGGVAGSALGGLPGMYYGYKSMKNYRQRMDRDLESLVSKQNRR